MMIGSEDSRSPLGIASSLVPPMTLQPLHSMCSGEVSPPQCFPAGVPTAPQRTEGEQKPIGMRVRWGNEVKGITTRPRALTDKTLTNLEQAYERSATGEAMTETEGAICNHSHSDVQLLIS